MSHSVDTYKAMAFLNRESLAPLEQILVSTLIEQLAAVIDTICNQDLLTGPDPAPPAVELCLLQLVVHNFRLLAEQRIGVNGGSYNSLGITYEDMDRTTGRITKLLEPHILLSAA